MKRLIFALIIFCFNAARVHAQRIFVEKTADGYEQPIIDKLISNSYKLTFKKDSADYVVMCIIGKSGMGRAKGAVAIINNKSGDLLVKSKEVTGQTMMFNGYANPKMLSMQKIADKYLIDCLNEALKKSH